MTYLPAFEKKHRDLSGKYITCAEWYETHDSAKPYRDRVMKAIQKNRFKSRVWQPHTFRETIPHPQYVEDVWGYVYHFVNVIRQEAGLPQMSKETFEEGKHCRMIFITPYKYALKNFWLLCWGDW